MDNEKLTTWITEVIEPLIKLLTPVSCVLCAEQNIVLCDVCVQEHVQPILPTCYSCNARSDDFSTCTKCRSRRARPKHVWTISEYKGEIKKIIYKMKFDSNRELARHIAKMLSEIVPLIEFDVITYVPSAPKRVRQRGYDHARLIAKHLAWLRGYQWERLLERTDNTRQVGATSAKRKRQAKLAYQYCGNDKRYENVLLVDDVISTGATIEACTSILRKNGVRNIYVASFARN